MDKDRPLCLLGYRVGEFDVDLNEPDPSLSAKYLRVRDQPRRVVAITGRIKVMCGGHSQLGYFVPDLSFPPNKLAASIHRFGCRMPQGDGGVLQDFYRYAMCFLHTHFEPVQRAELCSFDDWLDSCPYSAKRKKELREIREGEWAFREKDLTSKSFLKDEGYDKPKQPRAINSPSDLTKAIVGMFVHSMDKKTFSKKWFVKGINPKMWPELLCRLFLGFRVMTSDFTAFEAHQRGIFSKIIWKWMEHMLSGVAPDYVLRLMKRMVLGTNTIEFNDVTVKVAQRLMSGSMWTSSSNGFMNLLLMSFLACRSLSALPPDILAMNVDKFFVGLVEGDDGICRYVEYDERLIVGLGIKFKPDPYDDFNTASFCGVVCDPVTLKIVTDPIKVLRKFQWLNSQSGSKTSRRDALLRAKGLSMLYVYPDAPIVSALAWKTLSLVKRPRKELCDDARNSVDYFKRHLVDLGETERVWSRRPLVPDSSRFIVEKRFGITVSEQLVWEEKIYASTDGVFDIDLSLYCRANDDLWSYRYVLWKNRQRPYLERTTPPPAVEAVLVDRFLNAPSRYDREFLRLPLNQRDPW